MEENFACDKIELSSYRPVFLDTIDYYADGLIEFGYITFFAAAFPLGPLISLVFDSYEIRLQFKFFI